MLAPINITTVTVSDFTLDITVSYLATLTYILYYIYLFPAVGLITLPKLSGMVSQTVPQKIIAATSCAVDSFFTDIIPFLSDFIISHFIVHNC